MAHQTDNILNDDSSNGNPNANEFIDTVKNISIDISSTSYI